jgi:hypothetical protein
MAIEETYSENRMVFNNSGLSALENVTSANVFWDQIRDHLLLLPRQSSVPISHVVLAGEGAQHPDFKTVFYGVLEELEKRQPELLGQPRWTPETWAYHQWGHGSTYPFEKISVNGLDEEIDLRFVSARGAALYARWRQKAQPWCRERDECDEEREKERQTLASPATRDL